MTHVSRRTFLVSGLGALAALLSAAPAAFASRGPQHPDPRPGITGDNVATKEQLKDAPALIPLFDSVRAMPEIVDGIRCHCGCADRPGFRSLLSCFEGDAMARECRTCQGQARMAAKLRQAGKSLDEIRAAIDEKYS